MFRENKNIWIKPFHRGFFFSRGSMLWARGAAPVPGEVRMQQVNVVPCPQGGKGNQVSGGVNPWSGHPWWCQGVKSHLEACAALPRKCSHHSFPHKDHLGAMISKQDQLLCLIFPESEKHVKYVCFLHIFAYGHGIGTPYGWQMNPSLLNSWVSCRIHARFPWKTLSFPVGRVLGLPSGVSPSPGNIPGTWEIIILLCPSWIPSSKCFLSVPEYLAVVLGWESRQTWGNTLKQGEM